MKTTRGEKLHYDQPCTRVVELQHHAQLLQAAEGGRVTARLLRKNGDKEDAIMKRILTTAGWLVMATALMTGTAACGGDEPDEPVPESPGITGKRPSKLVDLSKLTRNYNAQDGDVLTGTLDGETQKYKITIAPGATVTLRDATINGVHRDHKHELWAGLTCLGDATIVLEGDNAVQNFNEIYPAIQPAHNDTGSGPEYTLTIIGSGSLTAKGHAHGAGIGANYSGTCGNIAISGSAKVTATSDWDAGIGSAQGSTCGDITISGSAKVTATGGNYAAGIGSTQGSTCGDIAIGGSAKVTATGGELGPGIGCGIGSFVDRAECGNITISDSAEVTAIGGEGGAGIGSGNGDFLDSAECGDITISGSASVTATGGEFAAGIGTGRISTCGSIVISGGFVMARGGYLAAGIGTGFGVDHSKAKCGDISITRGEGFVRVTAIRGANANNAIGPARSGSYYTLCGKIIFDRAVVLLAGDTEFYFPTDGNCGGLVFVKTTTEDGDDSTDNTDNTWTLKPR